MSVINANSIKVGNIIEYEGKILKVISLLHVKPGKGGAFMQLSLKDIMSGAKHNIRLRSSENVPKFNVYKQKADFLYIEKESAVFMEKENYEMIYVDLEMIEELSLSLLVEGMTVEIESLEGSEINKIIGISLPEKIIVKVLSSDPKVSNQGSNSYKMAKIHNDIKVQVPPFIDDGEEIIIRSDDLSYVERANK